MRVARSILFDEKKMDPIPFENTMESHPNKLFKIILLWVLAGLFLFTNVVLLARIEGQFLIKTVVEAAS